MICSHCQADNPAGGSACGDCGAVLATAAATPNPTPPQGASGWQPVPIGVTPVQAMPLPATPAPGPSAATPVASGPTTLVVERGGRVVFEVTPAKAEMLIGRADVDENGMPQIPDIDLTDADPERLSSRCHARLSVTGAAVFIADLGSANGTYLEGEGRLSPHQPRPLPPNARVMFGRGGPVLSRRA